MMSDYFNFYQTNTNQEEHNFLDNIAWMVE